MWNNLEESTEKNYLSKKKKSRKEFISMFLIFNERNLFLLTS